MTAGIGADHHAVLSDVQQAVGRLHGDLPLWRDNGPRGSYAWECDAAGPIDAAGDRR